MHIRRTDPSVDCLSRLTFFGEFTPSLSAHTPMLSIYISISITLSLSISISIYLSISICIIHPYTSHRVYWRRNFPLDFLRRVHSEFECAYTHFFYLSLSLSLSISIYMSLSIFKFNTRIYGAPTLVTTSLFSFDVFRAYSPSVSAHMPIAHIYLYL